MSENGATPASGDLRESLNAAAAPIRENLAILNRAIVEAEEELSEMRKLRTEAERVMKVLDPEFDTGRPKAGPKPKPKPKSDAPRKNISDEKVDAVLAWLRENVGPDKAFSVAAMNRGELGPFQVVPRGTLAFAIQALQDRGVIRLDRVGKAGRKEYKLIQVP